MEPETAEWSRVKTLFQSMLDMDATARRRFLEEQALPADVASAVEELLLAHDEAGSFLDPQALQRSTLLLNSPASRIQAGDVLADRFRVVSFRARGGMGEVYEAVDLELQMPVAIKVIRPEIADFPGMLNRFRREVHLARQVTHPNVCRIFDLFHHRDKRDGTVLFLTMELLNGETLSGRLRREGKLPERDAIVILHQLASALQAAHFAGVLHRDLKPGNIILEPGRHGMVRAVITDFGMALSHDARTSGSLTASGPFAFGTPEYMSPEQIEGKELLPSSDVYALGLVTYQMLTGVRAFDAETPLYSALRRLTEPPPMPRRLLPELSQRWDGLIARSLERNAAKRLASAAEFEAQLTTIERALPDVARTRWAWRRTVDWAAEHRWARAVGALALLLCIGGAVVGWRLHERQPVPEDLTVVLADFVNTTGEPAFDNSLNVALAAKLQQTPYLMLMPEQKIRSALQYMGLPARQRLTEQVARQVCEREAGQIVLQGFIANNATGYTVGLRAMECSTGAEIASRQVPVEFRDSVLNALDRATEQMRPILGEPHESIRKYDVPLVEATTPSFEAVSAFAQGTEAWNERGEAAALPYFQRATEIDPNFAMAYARLGTVYGNMGETQRAHEAMRQAYDRRDRVTEWERYYIVSHYYGFVTGEVDKEMQTYEEWAKAYPHDMAWTINLSVDYAFTGQYDKAIELQRRAIREIPGLSPSYGNLAQFFLAVEKPDEAHAVLEQANQLGLHDVNIQLDEYELAFYRDDKATLNKLLAGAAQFPGVEDTLLAQQAATEDRAGKLDAGAEFAAKAGAVATRSGAPETSATWTAEEAVRQAEMGRAAEARRLIAEAMANAKAAKGSDVRILAALAATESGDLALAQTMLREVGAERPLDTLVQGYWIPILRSRIAYAQGKYKQAVEDVRGTAAYDLGIFTPGQCMDATYVRGQALLADHQPQLAAEAFKQILDHQGLVLNCPTSALAQLGLARAIAQSGDAAASRTLYQDLLALWKDAGPGFALGRQAEAEYQALH